PPHRGLHPRRGAVRHGRRGGRDRPPDPKGMARGGGPHRGGDRRARPAGGAAYAHDRAHRPGPHPPRPRHRRRPPRPRVVTAPESWARTAARAAAYRLLGPRLAYLLHTRPAEWPIVAAHTGLGYLLAVELEGAARGEALPAALLGVALWVVCLNGGTLAINSAYDRDEGDVAYLRRPPPAPAHLLGFGLGLMAVGQGLAFFLPPAYRAVYALCFGLSVLYSVPPFRLKAVAGLDWLINMWGFGTLTPYAGWAATGLPVDPARALVLLAFCP